MSDRFRPRNDALSDEAIEWVVRLGGDPGPEARAAFEAWCRRSPAHAEAVRQARALLEDVGRTETAAEHRRWVRALAPPPRRGISRRALLVGGASAAAVAGLAGSGLLGPAAGVFADETTRVGQRRRLTLPDGSPAWLNTASALSVDFSATLRTVSVAAGEALFEVGPEARPFVARSRDGEAGTAGARYVLRREARHSAVVVLSGTVEVRNEAGTVAVHGDQRVAFGPGVLGLVEAVDAAALAAWTRGKLIFNRQPLAAVAAELERYTAGRVVVVGERLRRFEISGVFGLDDADALLRTVAGVARADIVRLPLLTLIR